MSRRRSTARHRYVAQMGGVLLGGLVLIGGSMAGGPAHVALAQEATAGDAKVILKSVNDSGVVGVASLTAMEGRTVVQIQMDGAMGDHPTHIHQGSCDDLDPNPEFPLTNVQLASAGLTGISDTTIDEPLQDLLATEHLILVHRSAKDIGTYIACGNIVAGLLSVDEALAVGVKAPLPGTGAGTTVGVLQATSWYLLILAGAISAAAGWLLRRPAPEASLLRRR